MTSDNADDRPFGILLSRDLFFGSKVTGTGQQLGISIELIGDSASALQRASDGHCRFVIVDLTLAGVDPAAISAGFDHRAGRPKLIAFGPHVQEASLEAAQRAGFDDVMPRSRFSATLVELLRSLMA